MASDVQKKKRKPIKNTKCQYSWAENDFLKRLLFAMDNGYYAKNYLRDF